MARRNLPSLSTPIIMASVALPIAIALLVGWALVFAGNLAQGEDVAANVWLLIGGVVAFIVLSTQMVMFAVFLGREILEVRRQDSFIDSVTHELKSPLASIKLGLQTLARPALDEDKRVMVREMMLGDVDRLSRFVDDILQASRLAHDRERFGVRQDDVFLRNLVEDCAISVRTQHKLDDDAVAVEVDEDLVTVTDEAALGVVIRNLIDNAVKYSNDPVSVRVVAIERKKNVVLEVIDNGIGIPRKDLKRVFHRFYRVDAEKVRSRKGTGLGLFVVWALVRSLGGRVEADSEGPGTGTTMRVRLPMNPRPEPA